MPTASAFLKDILMLLILLLSRRFKIRQKATYQGNAGGVASGLTAMLCLGSHGTETAILSVRCDCNGWTNAFVVLHNWSQSMLRRAFLSTALIPVLIRPETPPTDPWSADEALEPEAFAAQLKSNSIPPILYVGFPVLYKGAHIQGARLAGPCSKPDGLAALNKLAGELPRDREVVLYCGCCPLDRCPNVRPAYKALRDAGFTKLKVLHLATNLHTDWTSKGYPVEKNL